MGYRVKEFFEIADLSSLDELIGDLLALRDRLPAVIWYSVHCDTCGELITTSRASIRAAPAHAQMNCGASHASDGNMCLACRKAETRTQTEEMLTRKGTPTHSVSASMPNANPLALGSAQRAA